MQIDTNTAKQTRKIVTVKETENYRIVTDDPANWYVVANRDFAEGDLIEPIDAGGDIEVEGLDFVEVVLEETQESKLVYISISAVPDDASCKMTLLEMPWCFANHSCDPNVIDVWENGDAPLFNGSIAKADIAKGEEITFNYTLEYYEGEAFDCRCGSESCRGHVAGFKNLTIEQQHALLPVATPFVQERHRRESVYSYADISTEGKHLLADFWQCESDILTDEVALISVLSRAAEAAGATVLTTGSHVFPEQGVTAFALLAESHLSIHTWPDRQYAGVDLYTCGNCQPDAAIDVLASALRVGKLDTKLLHRGQTLREHSISTDTEEKTIRTGMEQDDSWYYEGTVPGKRHCKINHGFSVTDIILRDRSRYQEYMIFDNPTYERVLVLDGIVQLSTSDEHIYHEMLVHPPMFTHPSPNRVLIVGGGDGGTLREVLKHNPEEVVMIDIDEQFVRGIAEHLPTINQGVFEDPRLTLLFEDASEALKRYEDAFDVAIIDCNDDVGPSEVLFEEDFYRTVSKALKADGVCSAQAGSMLDVDMLQRMRKRMNLHLGDTTGYRLTVPIYHCGEYVFFAAARSLDPKGPEQSQLEILQNQRNVKTRYWSSQLHHASQVLPPDSDLW